MYCCLENRLPTDVGDVVATGVKFNRRHAVERVGFQRNGSRCLRRRMSVAGLVVEVGGGGRAVARIVPQIDGRKNAWGKGNRHGSHQGDVRLHRDLRRVVEDRRKILVGVVIRKGVRAAPAMGEVTFHLLVLHGGELSFEYEDFGHVAREVVVGGGSVLADLDVGYGLAGVGVLLD